MLARRGLLILAGRWVGDSTRGQWSPGASIFRNPGSDDLEVRSPSAGPLASAFALQIGGEQADASLTVVPPETWLRVGRKPPWPVSLVPGLEATLLGYMQAGDVRSARVVVNTMLGRQLDVEDARTPLFDIAAGYLLRPTGDARSVGWIDLLTQEYPNLSDVHVLQAWHGLRAQFPRLRAKGQLMQAATGVPAVPEGLRWLAQTLATVADDYAFGVHYRRLRQCLIATIDAPFIRACCVASWLPGQRPAQPASGAIESPKLAGRLPTLLQRCADHGSTCMSSRTARSIAMPSCDRPEWQSSSASRRSACAPGTR